MKIQKLLLVALLYSSCSFAYVIGGSNLSLSQYPEFDAYPPQEPYSRDRFDFDNYRSEVEEYVRKAKEYVENGSNDIKRISEAQDEAIQKANQAVERFNEWARRP